MSENKAIDWQTSRRTHSTSTKQYGLPVSEEYSDELSLDNRSFSPNETNESHLLNDKVLSRGIGEGLEGSRLLEERLELHFIFEEECFL